MNISYRVNYESLVDRNLKVSFQKYLREHQDNLTFKHYVEKLGVAMKYRSGLYYQGYTIFFESESQLSLFLLKWG